MVTDILATSLRDLISDLELPDKAVAFALNGYGVSEFGQLEMSQSRNIIDKLQGMVTRRDAAKIEAAMAESSSV